ncbi:hypothetical protein A2Y85_06270 [candidate division WOR-3 bacterium RBG_13_43_14]|uniref:DUF721 domain-containing protein n=1 Tax=candidate division WOR-3 bacterium RBG_13_43_14 TaxID=1802590 RepID=A0A1F4U379_UNCW3|nr:MAG: hypothetical protein A2Y85_06270 [candidate division WOR-3 bacterium RBG_13_43_14]
MKCWLIIEKWSDIVGPKIAGHAKAISTDLQCLFVDVDSPAWQHQLFIMKSDILKKIKQYDSSIKDIKFIINLSAIEKRSGHGKEKQDTRSKRNA